MPVSRAIVKSVNLDGQPHVFWAGMKGTARVRRRAVWTVIWDGKPRRMVTTLERGQQERGML